jgi:hypothetical protein
MFLKQLFCMLLAFVAFAHSAIVQAGGNATKMTKHFEHGEHTIRMEVYPFPANPHNISDGYILFNTIMRAALEELSNQERLQQERLQEYESYDGLARLFSAAEKAAEQQRNAQSKCSQEE